MLEHRAVFVNALRISGDEIRRRIFDTILIMTRWHEDDLAGRLLAEAGGPRGEGVALPAGSRDPNPNTQYQSSQAVSGDYPLSAPKQQPRPAAGAASSQQSPPACPA